MIKVPGMKSSLVAISALATLTTTACMELKAPTLKQVSPLMTRTEAVLLANAAATQAGYDLSRFAEPSNTGISGAADPRNPVWSFDYSTCGSKWVFDCSGFTVTVDKATGQAEALAWQ